MNPQLVYFAGFFWADGSILKNRCSLNIVKKDSIEVQEIVKPFLDFSLYSYVNKNTDSIRQPQESIKFNLKEEGWLQDLIKINYKNKSLDSPEFVFNLPKELQNYFWRGYSDGDGCFCNSTHHRGWSLSGPINKNWEAEKQMLSSLDISSYSLYKTETKNGSSSSLQIRHNKEVNKIANYLYSGEQFGLARKYKKWQEIQKNIDNIKESSIFVGVNMDKRSERLGLPNIWKCTYNRKHIGYFPDQYSANEARIKYISSL